MVATSATDTPDLTGTCWRDDLWLQMYGLLSYATALDYFAVSPFYDRSSNNEAARQRGMRLEQLPSSPGTEFLLQDSQAPHLFVIRKQLRSLEDSITNLAYYYILDGTIYQAPTLHAALQTRMDRCLFTLKSAFRVLRNDLDPLGARAISLLEAQAEAALQPENNEPLEFTTPEGRERQQRAERNVVATLLDFPLPYSHVAGAADDGVLKEEGSQEATVPMLSIGTLSLP